MSEAEFWKVLEVLDANGIGANRQPTHLDLARAFKLGQRMISIEHKLPADEQSPSLIAEGEA